MNLHPKVQNAAVAAMIVTVSLFVLSLFSAVVIPATVVAALTGLISLVVGYVTASPEA